MVDDQYPFRVQDSRLSVHELCTLDPHTPGDDSGSVSECVKNWTGSNPGLTVNHTYDVGAQTDPNHYNGLWRAKETLAYVEIQPIQDTTSATSTTSYLVRTRASEGVFITGWYYLWIGAPGVVPTDKNGVVDDAMVRVNADCTALDMQTLLATALAADYTVDGVQYGVTVSVTKTTAHAMYGIGASEWRITFNSAWLTYVNDVDIAVTGTPRQLNVEYRRPLVWPRQEWIFATFHSGGDGFEPTLLGTPEPLRGLPPSTDLFVSDGQKFYKQNQWNASSFVVDVHPNDDNVQEVEVTLTFEFAAPQQVDFVRIYPYYLVVGSQIKDGLPVPVYADLNDPRTHLYGSCERYMIRLQDDQGHWHNVTQQPYRVTQVPAAMNSSADVIFYDHRAPRQAQLPESLDTTRTPRTYANGSWWFDLPLLSFTRMTIVLYTDADMEVIHGMHYYYYYYYYCTACTTTTTLHALLLLHVILILILYNY